MIAVECLAVSKKKLTYICHRFQVICEAERRLTLVEIEENSQGICAAHYLDDIVTKRTNVAHLRQIIARSLRDQRTLSRTVMRRVKKAYGLEE